ncbi:alkaline phosphatase [Aliikangiella sp. IMCC44359]|uniref:alkaline phosphatase n=1 Tax=Aliikangiella sp. IMCC44359 TaxID=3459125 RepID=UPI00403A7F4C
MNKFVTSLIAVAVTSAIAGCADDGDNGANGTNGANSLIIQTELAIGDEECRNGGVQIESGLDANSNDVLEATEVSSTEYVCAPTVTEISNNDILNNTNNTWYLNAESGLGSVEEQVKKIVKERGQAKNIILFVGDGMGLSTVTAARILDGQNKGMSGEENNLSFDQFPFAGLAKTYNVDAQTPDSAGTMTAMMSGVKTDVGVIGINENVARGDCSSTTGNGLVTALELAEIAGLSTGVVSTARITHATPAATYAKSPDRNWEDISDISPAALDPNCKDIADQLVNFETNLEAKYAGLNVDGIEVVMGGGRRHFLPKDAAYNSPDAVSAVEGDRTDNRDLIAEWQAAYTNGVYVFDQTGFDAINPEITERVFGLFNESHMQYEADRANDIAGEPSLTEMTQKAIQILDNNEKGFFLMVESGRIDHGHHAGSAYNALTDTIEFSKAVKKAYEMTDPDNTLIIVTADHSHVLTIAGYPKRGNPILGKVVQVGDTEPALASDDMPYTTLGYTNGRGYRDLGNETDADEVYNADPVTGRVDLTNVNTQSSGFHQETLVPLSSETHAGEDVGIYASGPGAHLVSGTNEQSVIFHIMDFAGDLIAKANKAVN